MRSRVSGAVVKVRNLNNQKEFASSMTDSEGPKNLLTTTLGLSRGGMVLVGGPSHQSGVLIFIISAEDRLRVIATFRRNAIPVRFFRSR